MRKLHGQYNPEDPRFQEREHETNFSGMTALVGKVPLVPVIEYRNVCGELRLVVTGRKEVEGFNFPKR